MTLAKIAEAFARGAHAGQRHGDKPYWTHLRDVAKRLVKWGEAEDGIVVCAAWLHDTIEDTKVTYQDISDFFGYSVAEIVWLVTDEIGRNRKERKGKTYPKIFSTEKSTVLKLSDLYDNIFKSIENDDRYQRMYIREWPEIYTVFEDGLSRFRPDLMPVLGELDKMTKEISH